ncbi:MAG: hypothetical protein R3B51_11190 [Thermodesulfobacteriota bacterium]
MIALSMKPLLAGFGGPPLTRTLRVCPELEKDCAPVLAGIEESHGHTIAEMPRHSRISGADYEIGTASTGTAYFYLSAAYQPRE